MNDPVVVDTLPRYIVSDACVTTTQEHISVELG